MDIDFFQSFSGMERLNVSVFVFLVVERMKNSFHTREMLSRKIQYLDTKKNNFEKFRVYFPGAERLHFSRNHFPVVERLNVSGKYFSVWRDRSFQS